MQIKECLNDIRQAAARIGHDVRLMEVCGTHTMTAFRSGLRSLLPENVSLLSGPGCPVCVTPQEYIDRIIAIAKLPDTLVTTFGDMLRVPGNEESLEVARAEGAGVMAVYSPMDALEEAKKNPATRVVFFGVGFETTVPTTAWTIKEAARQGVENFSVLCAHKTMPHAMAALLKGGEINIDGFMCPGHVAVITGTRIFDFLCDEHGRPCVVAGFEPLDMALATAMLLRQIAEGRAEVENEYHRSVDAEGNPAARALIEEVFAPCAAEWRGMGTIEGSGLRIRDEFAQHDAAKIFDKLSLPKAAGTPGCICGDIIRGARVPTQCALFRKTCTPAKPVGACMVSAEGTCAAYYKYAGRDQGK